jgi:hypothetical protein
MVLTIGVVAPGGSLPAVAAVASRTLFPSANFTIRSSCMSLRGYAVTALITTCAALLSARSKSLASPQSWSGGNSVQDALRGACCVPQGLVHPLLDLELHQNRDLLRSSIIRNGSHPLRLPLKQFPATLVAIHVPVGPVDVQLDLSRDA